MNRGGLPVSDGKGRSHSLVLLISVETGSHTDVLTEVFSVATRAFSHRRFKCSLKPGPTGVVQPTVWLDAK